MNDTTIETLEWFNFLFKKLWVFLWNPMSQKPVHWYFLQIDYKKKDFLKKDGNGSWLDCNAIPEPKVESKLN